MGIGGRGRTELPSKEQIRRKDGHAFHSRTLVFYLSILSFLLCSLKATLLILSFPAPFLPNTEANQGCDLHFKWLGPTKGHFQLVACPAFATMRKATQLSPAPTRERPAGGKDQLFPSQCLFPRVPHQKAFLEVTEICPFMLV